MNDLEKGILHEIDYIIDGELNDIIYTIDKARKRVKKMNYLKDLIQENLNDEEILLLIADLLSDIQNRVFEDGWQREANKLNKIGIIINEVLKEDYQ